MRIANLDNRLVVLTSDGAIDVERESRGRFSCDPSAVYDRWAEFHTWAAELNWNRLSTEMISVSEGALGPPSPRPRQVFAIGLNYVDHVTETNFVAPDEPMVFTKFPTCLTGPFGDVTIPDGDVQVDWEIELVAIIGTEARNVSREDAWSHVAGLTIGQDISERRLQLAGSPAQFSLAKSFPGFGPTGPWLVTATEFDDPGDIGLECLVNGKLRQTGRTSQLIFSIPELVSRLSATLPLVPGDVIFTGTPSGVNLGSDAPNWLRRGDALTSRIEGIGEMRHHML